jgi:pimeloyl-ACP methyl ester carboxylesterase
MEKQKSNQQKPNFINQTKNPTIVLIHGLWMTPLCWENWSKRFQSHGYQVISPGWPRIDNKKVDEIRRNPDLVRGIGLEEITKHYEKIILWQDSPPIIMGHSIGGIIMQMLLNRGLGCAGVGISAGQTKGVLKLPFAMLRTAWDALKNPLNTNGIVELTYYQFKYSFTNGLPDSVSRAAFERYYIPGPTRPLIQAGFANFNPKAISSVDYANPDRAPLLFVGFGKDQTVPASVVKENAYKYKTLTATDFRLFPERTHYLGQEGWEEIADYCLNWAAREKTEFESNTLH